MAQSKAQEQLHVTMISILKKDSNDKYSEIYFLMKCRDLVVHTHTKNNNNKLKVRGIFSCIASGN